MGKVPVVDWGVVGFESEARDDAKVMAGATEAPEEVRIRSFGNGDGFSTRQYEVDVDDIVGQESVVALIATEAAAQGCSHDADTGAAP